MKFKKGDIVKVWSLQSFHGGGFLKGKEGVVSQDQIRDSVLVAVERKGDGGKEEIDPYYEVYDKQLELVSSPDNVTLLEEFEILLTKLRESINEE